MKPKQQPQIDFDKYRIDLSEEIKEPIPLISIGDKPLFRRGGISCISGRAKSRKTFLVALFASQFLESNDKGSIMIIDTEQSKFHVKKSVQRIHRLIGWEDNLNNDRLRVYYLREQSTDERKKFLIGVVNKYRPDLVFLDGVRDLVRSINDEAEATDIVNLLMKLSGETDSHICSVLHTNKADGNLRGHIGTEIVNKSETVILVEKDGDTSAVTPKDCRDIDFDKFYFRVNESGLPELCDQELKPKNTDALIELFSEILPAGVTLNYAELRSKVMEQCSVKQRAAEYKIKSAQTQSVIIKNKVDKYYLADTNNNTPIENELPF